jgi:hypothetical protein
VVVLFSTRAPESTRDRAERQNPVERADHPP